MGSDATEVARAVAETGKDWVKCETPTHQVRLEAFDAARHPTTNAMFRCFMEAGGYADGRCWHEAKTVKSWRPDGTMKDWEGNMRSQPDGWGEVRFSNPNQRVVGATWYEAVAYCR
jgi:formylglycine-generating enzyme required for sulfatase activity